MIIDKLLDLVWFILVWLGLYWSGLVLYQLSLVWFSLLTEGFCLFFCSEQDMLSVCFLQDHLTQDP